MLQILHIHAGHHAVRSSLCILIDVDASKIGADYRAPSESGTAAEFKPRLPSGPHAMRSW